MQRIILVIAYSVLSVLLIGCASTQPDMPVPIYNLVPHVSDLSIVYTYHSPDGNRLTQGHGTFPNRSYTDISLAGNPLWVSGKRLDDASLWVVVLDNGKVEGYLIKNGQIEETTVTPDN